MFCQLDQVKQILDMASAVKNILKEERFLNIDLDRKSCSILYGLLLLKDYDVFIQRGTVSFEGREFPHHWTEIYLDGEAFILDINLVSSAKVENRSEDIYFMPEEDAVKDYGYQALQEYGWKKEDCQREIWQRVLKELNISKNVDQVLEEIEEYSL
ncbi:hypothetical protein Dred_2661 [Desulforamulus reducens MI-1]|uniref:Uncharacterized protein n=1 Tax=Desulforamulus reducens (strain ATCC BAA-1160 / DSM 100696 / MI-1) TaxID=349161 RepID=A4J7W4_DESRM|nr:hypothetical protein [Desulforamulus reducens]ABO51167.1 hypothetical protein Dred_2661 [Desulforamulus reducens MI-1]